MGVPDANPSLVSNSWGRNGGRLDSRLKQGLCARRGRRRTHYPDVQPLLVPWRAKITASTRLLRVPKRAQVGQGGMGTCLRVATISDAGVSIRNPPTSNQYDFWSDVGCSNRILWRAAAGNGAPSASPLANAPACHAASHASTQSLCWRGHFREGPLRGLLPAGRLYRYPFPNTHSMYRS